MSATEIAAGVHFELDEATYHADRDYLSSTGARRILDSPARFRWELEQPRQSPAFDLGRAVHTKVLGVGSPVVTYPDEHLTPSGNVSTKAATVEWEQEQRDAGMTVLSRAALAQVDEMAEAVLSHKGARALFEQPGSAEVSVFATDPDSGVPCRARFDYLPDLTAGGCAVDLKTTSGTAGPGFARAAAAYGYPIQDVWYLDTLRWAAGAHLLMQMVVVEKAAPHFVAVHQFDDITRITARDLAARARRTYAECKATGVWPAYQDEPYTTQPPSWWFYAAEGDEQDMEIA